MDLNVPSNIEGSPQERDRQTVEGENFCFFYAQSIKTDRQGLKGEKEKVSLWILASRQTCSATLRERQTVEGKNLFCFYAQSSKTETHRERT